MEIEHDSYVFDKGYKSGTKCSEVVHVDGLLIAAMLVIRRSFSYTVPKHLVLQPFHLSNT